jgi:sortase (surface protein transpeptidase)
VRGAVARLEADTGPARSTTAALGIGVTLLVTAGIAGSSAPAAKDATAAARAASVTAAHATAARGQGVPAFRSVRTYQGVAVPVRLRIPSVGIDTALGRVGLAADGTIAVPSRWQVAGWYEKGPRPGQEGPAVIVGHVDSRSGPAVFFRLAELRPGDTAYVDRADGSSVRFRVTGHRQVSKSRFPADLVYSPTLQASLRLLTCGGSFDASTGHYRDNIIVWAVPV